MGLATKEQRARAAVPVEGDSGERGEKERESACHTSSCKQAWKNVPEVNSVQRRRRRRTKRGKDVPRQPVDALPSAGRLLRLFRKSQQSSTASFAQWLLATAAPRLLSSGLSSSFSPFSPSPPPRPRCADVYPRHCLCASRSSRGTPFGKYGRPTPNPLCRLSSIKFPRRSLKRPRDYRTRARARVVIGFGGLIPLKIGGDGWV